MYQNDQYAVGRDQLEKLGGEVRRGVMLWLTPRLVDFVAQHPDIKPQVITQTQAPDQQFDRMHLVLEAAVDGQGIALCPTSLLGTHLSSGQLICPLPELRMPLPRYYNGVAPDVTVQTRVFVEWLFARIAEDELHWQTPRAVTATP